MIGSTSRGLTVGRRTPRGSGDHSTTLSGRSRLPSGNSPQASCGRCGFTSTQVRPARRYPLLDNSCGEHSSLSTQERIRADNCRGLLQVRVDAERPSIPTTDDVESSAYLSGAAIDAVNAWKLANGRSVFSGRRSQAAVPIGAVKCWLPKTVFDSSARPFTFADYRMQKPKFPIALHRRRRLHSRWPRSDDVAKLLSSATARSRSCLAAQPAAGGGIGPPLAVAAMGVLPPHTGAMNVLGSEKPRCDTLCRAAAVPHSQHLRGFKSD